MTHGCCKRCRFAPISQATNVVVRSLLFLYLKDLRVFTFFTGQILLTERKIYGKMLLCYITQSLDRRSDGRPYLKPMSQIFLDHFFSGSLAGYKIPRTSVYSWINSYRTFLLNEYISKLSSEQMGIVNRVIWTRGEREKYQFQDCDWDKFLRTERQSRS